MGRTTKRSRRRGPRPSDVELKLEKFRKAKSLKGKMNYGIDFVFDQYLQAPVLDELAHLGVELLLSRDPLVRRIARWSRGFIKFRLSGLPHRVVGTAKAARPRARRSRPLTGKSINLFSFDDAPKESKS